MIKRFSLLIFFFITAMLLKAQTPAASRLYNSKRQLIADTTFHISKQQLAKWIPIEDSLSQLVLNNLVYPAVLKEAGISGKLLISFTIDQSGIFNDFKVETYQDKMPSDSAFSDSAVKMFKKEGFRATMKASGMFVKSGFTAHKDKPERFYLPVDFTLVKSTTERQLKNGWLTFQYQVNPVSTKVVY